MADILQAQKKQDLKLAPMPTTPEPDSAKNEARRVAELGFDLVVAAGGDGTINEVVTGSLRLNTVLKWPSSHRYDERFMLEH